MCRDLSVRLVLVLLGSYCSGRGIELKLLPCPGYLPHLNVFKVSICNVKYSTGRCFTHFYIIEIAYRCTVFSLILTEDLKASILLLPLQFRYLRST